MLRSLFLLAALSSIATAALAQPPVAKIPTADAKGARDNPLLKRYEGSYIVADFSWTAP